MKIMRGFFSFLLLCLCIGRYAHVEAAEVQAVVQPKVVAAVAVVVNHDMITLYDWQQEVAWLASNGGSRVQAMTPAQLKEQAKITLIAGLLQKQQAEKLAITLSERERHAALTHFFKVKGLTVEQWKKRLSAKGSSYHAFKVHFFEQVLLQKTQSQVLLAKARDQVKPSQVRALRQQNNARLIHLHVIDYHLVAEDGFSAKQWQLLHKRAHRVYRMLSKDSRSKPKQVEVMDWGWQTLAQMPTPLARALRVNKVVPKILWPVRTGNGYHILHVLGRKDEPGQMSDDQAYQALLMQAMGKQVSKWLDHLQEVAYIKELRAL
jgi:peptidyl-prolyl cis-trans isomerase SurA